MRLSPQSAALIAMATIMLAACGGSGGDSIASAPIPSPTPTPTPTPAPVLPPASIGLVSDNSFKAIGLGNEYRLADFANTAPADRKQTVEFRYIPASNTYEVTLPGYESGTLQTEFYNGSSGSVAESTGNFVTMGPSQALQSVLITLPVPRSAYSPFSYTAFGFWSDEDRDLQENLESQREGVFAYGIPTASGDAPLSGSSSYKAEVKGYTAEGNYVGGSATLNFDFASGVLSGSMRPMLSDGWDLSIEVGTYTFRDTVYSSGGTDFSGRFEVPGLPAASSYFEGSFNGPQAAELMARWQAPLLFDGDQGSMFGIWVGKKD